MLVWRGAKTMSLEREGCFPMPTVPNVKFAQVIHYASFLEILIFGCSLEFMVYLWDKLQDKPDQNM